MARMPGARRCDQRRVQVAHEATGEGDVVVNLQMHAAVKEVAQAAQA